MSRLFESEFDRIIYGDQFVEFFKGFNDRVAEIEEKYSQFFEEESLFDMFGFDLVDKQAPSIIFYNDDKPQSFIMEEVFAEFQARFPKK